MQVSVKRAELRNSGTRDRSLPKRLNRVVATRGHPDADSPRIPPVRQSYLEHTTAAVSSQARISSRGRKVSCLL